MFPDLMLTMQYNLMVLAFLWPMLKVTYLEALPSRDREVGRQVPSLYAHPLDYPRGHTPDRSTRGGGGEAFPPCPSPPGDMRPMLPQWHPKALPRRYLSG